MSDVLSKPVLILNRVFAPVQLTTAKRAFVLLYGGAARAVDESGEEYDFDLWRHLPVREDDDALPIVGGSLRVPRVLHLDRYDRTPRVTVRLTRRNLMFRDQHKCQYCGKQPPTSRITAGKLRISGGIGSAANPASIPTTVTASCSADHFMLIALAEA